MLYEVERMKYSFGLRFLVWDDLAVCSVSVRLLHCRVKSA